MAWRDRSLFLATIGFFPTERVGSPIYIMSDDLPKTASEARRLIRTRDHAALATSLRGWPYASLVAMACDLDASPLLLLSDLAAHTRNLAAGPRVSLLFDATSGFADPLAGPRLTLLGRAERTDD